MSEWDVMTRGGHGYNAAEEPGGRDNPQVAASLMDLCEVDPLDPETPEDIMDFYVEEGNDEVAEGAKRTVIQEYKKIPEIEASFLQERDDMKKDMDARGEKPPVWDGAAYEVSYSQHMRQKFPGYFNGSFNAFKKARETKRRMEQRGLWEGYLAWITQKCRTASKDLDTLNVVSINDKILNMFGGEDTPDNEHNDLIIAMMRCTVPTLESENANSSSNTSIPFHKLSFHKRFFSQAFLLCLAGVFLSV